MLHKNKRSCTKVTVLQLYHRRWATVPPFGVSSATVWKAVKIAQTANISSTHHPKLCHDDDVDLHQAKWGWGKRCVVAAQEHGISLCFRANPPPKRRQASKLAQGQLLEHRGQLLKGKGTKFILRHWAVVLLLHCSLFVPLYPSPSGELCVVSINIRSPERARHWRFYHPGSNGVFRRNWLVLVYGIPPQILHNSSLFEIIRTQWTRMASLILFTTFFSQIKINGMFCRKINANLKKSYNI